MADQVKKVPTKNKTGLVSPFIHCPQNLRVTKSDRLNVVNSDYYKLVKNNYWGYVSVLKHYAYLLHKANQEDVFVIEAKIGADTLRVSLRKAIYHPKFTKQEVENSTVVSLCTGEYLPTIALFDIRTSHAVFCKTACVDVQQEMREQMLICAAKMITSGPSSKKYAVEKTLKDLGIID